MMTPTIHLNGTSREGLYGQTCAAMGAIRRALAAMCEAEPNARDYYPQGPKAFGDARVEHLLRVGKLQEVLVELQDMAEAIMDGGK